MKKLFTLSLLFFGLLTLAHGQAKLSIGKSGIKFSPKPDTLTYGKGNYCQFFLLNTGNAFDSADKITLHFKFKTTRDSVTFIDTIIGKSRIVTLKAFGKDSIQLTAPIPFPTPFGIAGDAIVVVWPTGTGVVNDGT